MSLLVPAVQKIREAAATVIAYEKIVSTQGGWVLLRDKTVKQMTADEFKTASRANSSN